MVSADTYNKAIILGAAGFVGINLAQALDEQGFEVVCFDRAVSSHWPKRAIPIVGDFTGLPVELIAHFEGALVFHLVSCTRPTMDTGKAMDEIDHDVKTTVKYLESTKGRRIRWIFLSSGGTVYGKNGGDPITELHPTNPICSYGITKLFIESYFSLYKHLYETDYVVVRLSNPYGPWQKPMQGQGIIPTMLYKALQGQAIEIWGDGSVVRDYIYIEDASKGIVSAALNGKSGEIYNVSTGNGLSITQLIQIIQDQLHAPLEIKYSAGRSVDVMKNILNADKLFSRSGWRWATTIDRGISLTIQWMRENYST